MIEQLSSDSQDKLIVFGAKQIRRLWVDDQWYFSIVDIVAALTDSDNPRNYWNMMKARELKQSEVQLSTFCVQLKLTSADGKAYKTDCVNTEAAFRIIQSIPSPKKVVSGSHAPRENQSIYIDQAAIFHLDKNLAPFDLFPHSINGDITA